MSTPNLLNLLVLRLVEEVGIFEENDEKGLADSANPFILLVRPARFELATYGFVVRRSIRAELRAHSIIDKFL